jgi:hypothetical protein
VLSPANTKNIGYKPGPKLFEIYNGTDRMLVNYALWCCEGTTPSGKCNNDLV